MVESLECIWGFGYESCVCVVESVATASACSMWFSMFFLQDFIHSGRDSFPFKIENPNTSLDFYNRP